MTGQQLRNSIFQEAIHGRLVPNVLQPGEKTGEELLKAILAERQKKENEEKGKKAKTLTLSTVEEEPWELPEGWCWCKLGDVISLQSGRDLEPDKYNASSKGIPYITGASNFDKGAIIINRWTPCPVSVSKKGDLLITCKGTVGELAFNTVGDVHIARQIMAISTIVVDANYLQVFFKAKVNDLNAQANGVIPGISREDILLSDSPLPPLSIQKAIVAKIEELIPLIDEYDKAAVELETLNKTLPDKLRKSVLQEAIHGNLVPNVIPEGEATAQELLQQILKERQEKENKEKGKKAKKLTLSTIEDEPWELPEGWCWCRVEELLDFVDYRGKTPKKIDRGVFLITASNIKKGYLDYTRKEYISRTEYAERQGRGITERGDLLFTTEAPLGNAALCDLDECSCGQRIITMKNYYKGTLCLKLYMYFILSDSFQRQLRDNCSGMTATGIKAERLKKLQVPLPPLSIQHRIVKKIEEVFAAIDKL